MNNPQALAQRVMSGSRKDPPEPGPSGRRKGNTPEYPSGRRSGGKHYTEARGVVGRRARKKQGPGGRERPHCARREEMHAIDEGQDVRCLGRGAASRTRAARSRFRRGSDDAGRGPWERARGRCGDASRRVRSTLQSGANFEMERHLYTRVCRRAWAREKDSDDAAGGARTSWVAETVRPESARPHAGRGPRLLAGTRGAGRWLRGHRGGSG